MQNLWRRRCSRVVDLKLPNWLNLQNQTSFIALFLECEKRNWKMTKNIVLSNGYKKFLGDFCVLYLLFISPYASFYTQFISSILPVIHRQVSRTIF